MAIIVLVLGAASAITIAVTRDSLMDQVDQRLMSFSQGRNPDRFPDGLPGPKPPSARDVFVGRVDAEGDLRTLIGASTGGKDFGTPDLGAQRFDNKGPVLFTVESTDADTTYRVLAEPCQRPTVRS